MKTTIVTKKILHSNHLQIKHIGLLNTENNDGSKILLQIVVTEKWVQNICRNFTVETAQATTEH